MMCYDVVFFMVFVLQFHYISLFCFMCVCEFIVFIRFGNFSPIISSDSLSAPPLSSALVTASHMYQALEFVHS